MRRFNRAFLITDKRPLKLFTNKSMEVSVFSTSGSVNNNDITSRVTNDWCYSIGNAIICYSSLTMANTLECIIRYINQNMPSKENIYNDGPDLQILTTFCPAPVKVISMCFNTKK